MSIPTTLAELDRRHAEASGLIRRRAVRAGAKAFVIGREDLPSLLDEIAAIYDLSPADRAALAPAAPGATAETPAAAAAGGIGLADALAHAKRAGKLVRTARTVATGAGVVARGGRLLGRAVPLAAAAWGAYAVGTGGWFFYRANAFNQAAYDLLRARITPPSAR